VLELVVTEFLYKNYEEPEGVLTNWRSALVRTESISAAAQKAGCEDLLRLSRGERKGTDRARAQILANCYEAVVGALYLDQGYDKTKDFIARTILVTFDQILATGSWMDAKSRLQEMAQNKEGATPVYRVLHEEGPDHDKVFTIGVFIGKELRGKGSGPSKQIGQQKAAEKALRSYQN
jgi:ribonuclease-3